jgi:hypothetical protein
VNIGQYARAQARPLGPLRKLVRALLHTFGVPITPFQISEVALRLYRPVLNARASNYAIATRYLDDLRLPSGIVVPAPRAYPIQAVTSTLGRVITDLRVEGDPITEKTRTDARVIEMVRPAVEGPISRQAVEPAREIVAKIGEDEHYENYGWARVLVGAYSCGFCAMLASRGPVYTSEAAALGKGGSPMSVYHTPYPNRSGKVVGGFCDCQAVLVARGKSWEGQAAHGALEKLWGDEAQGSGDALNAFRRAWERKVRAGETGQYLAPSLRSAA